MTGDECWSGPHPSRVKVTKSDQRRGSGMGGLCAQVRRVPKLTYAGGMHDPQSNGDSATSTVEDPRVPQIRAALHRVNDPEIRRPITDLGMVDAIDVDADNRVRVEVLLTVSGCPMKDTLRRDVTAAVSAVPGVSGVE